MRQIKINHRWVGEGHPVYIIAEIGINHNGSLKTALQLIDAAAEAGVDAVKFQTYHTEKRTARTSPIFDILKKCELPFEAFKELKQYAESKLVDFFSTPFDEESAEYLATLNVPLYKIASFDIKHQHLLQTVARTQKPVILSVGMSNTKEIATAYKLITVAGSPVVLLHCITSYPTQEKDANLSVLTTLREQFPCVVGQSDHTPGIEVPLYAVAAGARVLEKHFKINADMDCVDAPVSIDQEQMKKLIKETRRLETILGSPELKMRDIEKPFQWLRREKSYS